MATNNTPRKKSVSRKVKALKRRLLRTMLAVRESKDRGANYYHNIERWVTILNRQAVDSNADLPVVTNPMVRRCMVMLHDEGKVDKEGYGRQVWRARTVGDRLEKAAQEQRVAATSVLVDRLEALGLTDVRSGYKGGSVYASPESMQAICDMLTNHPRIARRYLKPPAKEDDDG